ncbi:MAG: adenine phosphoribosyltransferase [Verrucomicrobiales bacterium]|jgi:adenine phosphoribosyltransferase|nr:adenine phosphoribosyltransferase [Verrucomicrobiales bacterium]
MQIMQSAKERLRLAVRDVQDFPKDGVVFKDITPIIEDAQLFRLTVTVFADHYKRKNIEQIVAIDARGFLCGSALAYVLGTGISVVRKKGKLPYKTISTSYDLEYGFNTVEMHVDSIKKNQRVLVIDDVLATGGTAKAAISLVQQLGGHVVEAAFLMELEFLNGKEAIAPTPCYSIIKY